MGTRGRRWSLASSGFLPDLSAIHSPIVSSFPSSWPNSPENQDVFFDSSYEESVFLKVRKKSNSIGELFNGSWTRSNSVEETVRFKAPKFSLNMFQIGSKNSQKAGLSIVTLLNGNNILVSTFF